MSSITVGKYVMWKNEHKEGSKVYKKGTISKIVDIDTLADVAYFNAMDSVSTLAIAIKGLLHDSNIEALEASEDLLNPEPVEKKDDAGLPPWHVAAMAAGMISSSTRKTMPPPSRPTSWTTSTHHAEKAPDYYSFRDTDAEDKSTANISYRYEENSCITFKLKGEEYDYTVEDDYLDYDDGDNDMIFHALGITSNSSQLAFCKRAYGYAPIDNDYDEFPSYKMDDYQAAERLIDAIKAECRKQNADWEEKRRQVIWSSPRHVGRTAAMASGRDPYTREVEEKFEYTPVYKLGTYVEFDTGRVSYSYKVQSHYMTCSSGWDAIYKELGVNPESFIREATGKNAVYHRGPYGIVGHDMVSSDKLINALLKACADRRGTARYVDATSGDHVSPLADPIPSYEDVLEKLKVDQLEVN